MKAILVLFAVFALACANIYDVTVKLGSQYFAPVEHGTLYMTVLGRNGRSGHFKITTG